MAYLSDAEIVARRNLAKSYLLNISLDGSYPEKENVPNNVTATIDSKVELKNTSQHGCDEKSEVKIPLKSNAGGKVSPVLSNKNYNRERSNTSSSSDLIERRSCLKKRKTFTAAVMEESYHSSSESLNAHASKALGGSVSDSSSSMNKEVKFFKRVKENEIKDERLVLTSSRQIPFCILSILPFTSKSFKARSDIRGDVRRRHLSGSRPLSTISDTSDLFDLFGMEKEDLQQDTSYKHLLEPAKMPAKRHLSEADVLLPRTSTNVNFYSCDSQNRSIANSPGTNNVDREVCEYHSLYHANALDDPELSAGKHRTLLTFSSYRTSVIDYVRPADLKKEINEKFKERFPYIQLTLTKLRSLKREIRKIACQECSLDYLTVAQAFVYFEKFILHNKINKQNRKLSAGACLLLSAKMNDVKRPEIQLLIEKIENAFRVNKKDLLAAEFIVLVVLEFSLLLPTWEIHPHYQRLLYES